VGALCINQSNEVEKNTQVMKMAQIYNNADNVCIRFGQGMIRTSHDIYQAACYIGES
ncbi:hypothetical protein K469DRAFT_545217, partial [Zopfia rhizophila CBS 207.26]